MPVDDLVDVSAYLPNALGAVQLAGQTWGMPISFGNHLMLYTNKDLIAGVSGRQRRAHRGRQGQDRPSGNYGFAFHQTESFWLLPVPGSLRGQRLRARTASPRP